MTTIFDTIKIGATQLANRIAMAPMTRNRAGKGNVPTELQVLYYTQRATAGLLITEASQISLQGIGYPATPGIHTREQVAGWRKVTDSVHAKGGKIFIQLWHVGRISHPSLQPNGQLPVSASAIKPDGMAITYQGPKPFETPRALDAKEIPGIIQDYKSAAANAILAGFDGVEIHGANGYLLDQFLRDGTNKRSDEWGGSVKNRARLMLSVVEAVTAEIGSEKVAIRISPYGTFNGMSDSDLKSTFGYVVQELNKYNLAYLHIIECMSEGDVPNYSKAPLSYFRSLYKGTLMTNSGYTLEKANAVLAEGQADMVAFGKYFISNPDLVARLKNGLALTPYDPNTFYGGTEKGYTDYDTAS